jgi:hypothetical protein
VAALHPDIAWLAALKIILITLLNNEEMERACRGLKKIPWWRKREHK